MDFLFSNQLITFIAGIAILIFLHEVGHFVAARLLKVEVEEFGLGFPPRIVKLFKAGGTEFTLNWIPLGGFVRMKGESDPTEKGGFASASPWVRLLVLFAGPFTNIMIGLVLGIFLFFSLGERIPEQVLVRDVAEDAPAAQAGLMDGDLFLEVNGVSINSMASLQEEISLNLGHPINILVDRGGEIVSVTLTPRENPPQGQGAIGVVLDNPTRPVSIAEAATNGASEFTRIIHTLVTLPVQMLSGNIEPEEGRLVGYKGMFEIYQQIPSRTWFFMMISISLGILNLLPFPALDGGRIALILPEIFLRRRIPARYENMIHLAGFIFLILLMVWINIQDFINPIDLPQ